MASSKTHIQRIYHIHIRRIYCEVKYISIRNNSGFSYWFRYDNISSLNLQIIWRSVKRIIHIEIQKDWNEKKKVTWYLMAIWPGDLLYFSAIATILGSLNNWGSSLDAHGLSGEPSGLYAVIRISLLSQNSFNFFWFKYGWHSTFQFKEIINNGKLNKQYILERFTN